MKIPEERIRLEAEHQPEIISERLEAKKQSSYLGDAVLGAIDGCVTTFAVVCGVLGGQLRPSVALLLGAANLLADGFSMAVSNYQRAKSERELIEKVRRTEERHIAKIPEGEKEEIYQIFRRKGFAEPILSQVVETITKDKKLWIDTMLTEEFGLSLAGTTPWKAGMATFLAFVLVGTTPLLPFVFAPIVSPSASFIWSFALTTIAFFFIGGIKGKILNLPVLRSGLETLLLGSGAALLAYGVTFGLRTLVTL